MKLAVIANPLSGANRRRPARIDGLQAILGERGELARPGGLPALRSTLARFADEGVELLGICGGDGTIHQVMTALVAVHGEQGTFPTIALLKGGTMNTIARNIGLRTRAERLLQRLQGDSPLRFTERTLMITDEQRAGFIFGTAGIASFLEAYYDGGASPLTAVAVMARCIGSALIGGAYAGTMFRHCPMTLCCDGETLSADRFTTLGVATVADLGFGFRPFYAAPSHPGHLQLIGIGCTPFQFAAAVPTIRLARPIQREDVVDQLAKTVKMRFAEPLGYTLDGDLYPPRQSITLRAGPAIRFVTD